LGFLIFASYDKTYKLYIPDLTSFIFCILYLAYNINVSAFSIQLSAFSIQLSAFSIQISAFSIHLSAFSYQHSASSFQHSASSFQHSAFSLHHSALSLQHAAPHIRIRIKLCYVHNRYTCFHNPNNPDNLVVTILILYSTNIQWKRWKEYIGSLVIQMEFYCMSIYT
jgi:hypothetical protein